MSERTAVPERVSRRAKPARRGGGVGSQPVDDYVGQPAGDAAQAVRRAGLRPGLDRSFGCPEELIGLVVAQDPAAGSDLARNGMVTLYVAASGVQPAADTAIEVTAGGQPDELAAAKPIEPSPSASPATPARTPATRRKKPGQARRTTVPQADTPPPVAAIEETGVADLHQPPVTAADTGWPAEDDAPGDASLENDLARETGERDPPEDLVMQVEDVLAGRGGPPDWRRVHTQRGGTAARGQNAPARLRAWLGAHRLAGALAVALALWIILSVAVPFDRGRARSSPSSALAAKARPRTALHGGVEPRPPAPPKRAARRTARSHRVRRARRKARVAPATRFPHPATLSQAPSQSTPPAARASREAVAPARGEPQAEPQPSEAAAPPASAPTASAPPAAVPPEQQGGGPFSP